MPEWQYQVYGCFEPREKNSSYQPPLFSLSSTCPYVCFCSGFFPLLCEGSQRLSLKRSALLFHSFLHWLGLCCCPCFMSSMQHDLLMFRYANVALFQTEQTLPPLTAVLTPGFSAWPLHAVPVSFLSLLARSWGGSRLYLPFHICLLLWRVTARVLFAWWKGMCTVMFLIQLPLSESLIHLCRFPFPFCYLSLT